VDFVQAALPKRPRSRRSVTDVRDAEPTAGQQLLQETITTTATLGKLNRLLIGIEGSVRRAKGITRCYEGE
jgi:hypothetical protein